MVAAEFFNFCKKINGGYTGVEDFADRLSFGVSTVVLILSIIVIGTKQYVFNPLSCYIATAAKGSNFESYVENFCWVKGTIPFKSSEEIPQNEEDWQKADQNLRISYYQWVPFVLGLQCMMFYLPRLIWQIISYNQTGSDLDYYITAAHDAATSIDLEKRSTIIKHLSRNLEQMFYQHRDFREGKLADCRRKMKSWFGILMCSKRMGTWLIFMYLCIKLLYLANCVAQVLLMKQFLGIKEKLSHFGINLLIHISKGMEWQTTRFFPRISYCVINVRHLGSTNTYVAQCALPINMLNEKIYIFLWFWVCFVAAMTLISIPVWIGRIAIRRNSTNFLIRYLKMQSVNITEYEHVDRFVRDFLRPDGVFLIRMITLSVGDIVATELVKALWLRYVKKYIGKPFKRANEWKLPPKIPKELRKIKEEEKVKSAEEKDPNPEGTIRARGENYPIEMEKTAL